MSFEERVQLGFDLALNEGLDLFFAMSSVLVAIGERFSQQNTKIDIRPLLRNPQRLSRLLRGVIKSKLGAAGAAALRYLEAQGISIHRLRQRCLPAEGKKDMGALPARCLCRHRGRYHGHPDLGLRRTDLCPAP